MQKVGRQDVASWGCVAQAPLVGVRTRTRLLSILTLGLQSSCCLRKL
jgi:hypothetical protein